MQSFVLVTAFLVAVTPFYIVLALPTEPRLFPRAAANLLISNDDGWAEANYRQAYATYVAGGYNVRGVFRA
jgi:hypothetical protein